jgi:hypothetical protein
MQEAATMSVTNDSSTTRSSFQFALPGESTVIGILLVVFLVLHVVAGALLQSRAPTGAAPAEEARLSLYD